VRTGAASCEGGGIDVAIDAEAAMVAVEDAAAAAVVPAVSDVSSLCLLGDVGRDKRRVPDVEVDGDKLDADDRAFNVMAGWMRDFCETNVGGAGWKESPGDWRVKRGRYGEAAEEIG